MLISARRVLKRLSGTKTIILQIIRIVAIITVRHLQEKDRSLQFCKDVCTT